MESCGPGEYSCGNRIEKEGILREVWAKYYWGEGEGRSRDNRRIVYHALIVQKSTVAQILGEHELGDGEQKR